MARGAAGGFASALRPAQCGEVEGEQVLNGMRVQQDPFLASHVLYDYLGCHPVPFLLWNRHWHRSLLVFCARRVISVSRLDRDTSGVLVAATCQEGADCLTNQFKDS